MLNKTNDVNIRVCTPTAMHLVMRPAAAVPRRLRTQYESMGVYQRQRNDLQVHIYLSISNCLLHPKQGF